MRCNTSQNFENATCLVLLRTCLVLLRTCIIIIIIRYNDSQFHSYNNSQAYVRNHFFSRARSLDDQHGVYVSELNTDVDYRDFNETVDLATETSNKAAAASLVQNHYGFLQYDIGTAENNGW